MTSKAIVVVYVPVPDKVPYFKNMKREKKLILYIKLT